ncbi:unnamed protein product, partial [Porites lobata]
MADWPIVKFWLCVMSSNIRWTGPSTRFAYITASCKAGERVKESLSAAIYMFVGITTATKNTTRKKVGTGDKRDALELETSRKRVRRMMGASAVHMHEIVKFYASNYDSDFDSVAGEISPKKVISSDWKRGRAGF